MITKQFGEGPPNETGRSDDPARLQSAVTEHLIAEAPSEIKPAVLGRWITEAQWLTEQCSRSNDPKALDGLRRHLNGIRRKIAAPAAKEAMP